MTCTNTHNAFRKKTLNVFVWACLNCYSREKCWLPIMSSESQLNLAVGGQALPEEWQESGSGRGGVGLSLRTVPNPGHYIVYFANCTVTNCTTYNRARANQPEHVFLTLMNLFSVHTYICYEQLLQGNQIKYCQWMLLAWKCNNISSLCA